jgi:hypothetical protein
LVPAFFMTYPNKKSSHPDKLMHPDEGLISV